MGPVLAILRRLLRVAVALFVRALIGRAAGRGRGPRATRGRRGASGTGHDGVVIDVRPLGTLDRYTDGARRAVIDAAELADRLGAGRVDTPHLLAALAGREDAAGALLREQGVAPEQVEAALDRRFGGETPSPEPDRPAPPERVTPGLGAVLRTAGQVAGRHERDAVGSLDLLRALAESGDAAYETTLAAVAPDAADRVRSRLG